MKKLETVRTLWRASVELYKAASLETSILVVIILVQGLIPAFSLYLTKFSLDNIGNLLAGQEGNISRIVILWISILIIGTVLAPINQVLQGNIAEKFTAHINLRLMDKMDELLGLDILEDTKFHDDLDVLQRGASSRPLNVFTMLIFTIRDIISLVGLSVVLISVGWWVPFLVLLGSYPLALMTLKLREMGWAALISSTPDAREMEYNAKVALSYSFASETRLFNTLPWLRERYKKAFDKAHSTMRRARRAQAVQVLPYSFFGIFISGGLLIWTIYQAIEGRLTPGAIVVIITGLAQVQQTIFSLIESSGILFERGLYFQKYFEFLEAESQVSLPTEPQNLSHNAPSIKYENVSFSYSEGRQVLNDINFEIRSGETIAIVGENGAGKSTLIKLLLRFYDCSSGRIILNGQDLRNLDLKQWRSRTATVAQNFGCYSFTLAENITLGHVEKNENFQKAVLQSGVNDFLPTLTNGTDTMLGKEFGGTDLSGGQWQKVAMARALYRDASLLILDEPTSSLDPRSEYELFQRFIDLSQGRTTIVVTHRLGSVLHADRIFVMKQGELIESGTHQELLRSEGEYADLWKMQASLYSQ